ncbi:Lrp/AsnC family transcriptional regulator [Spongisporangium articulatum]|uniref:Lrp/AsnC family transcriptional regulator n=1 Tax=Spongisporangium articulatum TaxID=3362603 RepID=A0ABW8ANJ6_9ACTN
MTLDRLDARILLALDDDPEATVLSLARELGVARNTVHARLRRLNASGVVRGFSHRVSPEALGYGLTAFVAVAVAQSSAGPATEQLARIPEVVEVHATTGEADLLARVVAKDTADLYRITARMLAVDGVIRSDTTISLAELVPARVRPLLQAIEASGQM